MIAPLRSNELSESTVSSPLATALALVARLVWVAASTLAICNSAASGSPAWSVSAVFTAALALAIWVFIPVTVLVKLDAVGSIATPLF